MALGMFGRRWRLKGWLADLMAPALRAEFTLRYLVVLCTPSRTAHGASTHTVERLWSAAEAEPLPGLSSSLLVKACDNEQSC